MKQFVVSIPGKLVFGAGSVADVGIYSQSLGKKALIVTGVSSRPAKYALIGNIRMKLLNQGIDSVVFSDVEANPTTDNCNDAVRFGRDCDFVLGVGGGSSMDAAKVVATLLKSGGYAEDYYPGGTKFGQNFKPVQSLPIALVTTTSGTGSEVTPYAVLTNSQTLLKATVRQDSWYAQLAIVDPELMVSMPEDITKHTGVDAFFHAFEAYTARGANPYSDIYARNAMELIVQNLKKCVDNPEDIDARSKVAFANTLAGTAIALCRTHAIHGMATALGGRYNTVHGISLCALGPAVTEFCHKGNIKKFADAAIILGSDPAKGNATLASECSQRLYDFLNKFDLVTEMSDLGVDEDGINDLLDDTFFAMEAAMKNAPVEISRESAEDLYYKSL